MDVFRIKRGFHCYLLKVTVLKINVSPSIKIYGCKGLVDVLNSFLDVSNLSNINRLFAFAKFKNVCLQMVGEGLSYQVVNADIITKYMIDG